LKSNRNEKANDKLAAIGIGAMIVFIALILVAAVAAAVIIQTAEKLQQNAQTAGDDTADNMAGKVLINSVFVDTAAAGNSYLAFVTMAPGSEATPEASVTFQIFCDSGSVEGDTGEMSWLQMSGNAVGGAGLQPGTPYQVTLDASGGDDCSPDNLGTDGEATMFIHVANGGSTYEKLVVDDDSAGAIVV